jgi:hypothetical protein
MRSLDWSPNQRANEVSARPDFSISASAVLTASISAFSPLRAAMPRASSDSRSGSSANLPLEVDIRPISVVSSPAMASTLPCSSARKALAVVG